MLSSPHQLFCEAIVSGLTRTDAYAAAYPSASRPSAQNHGSRLFGLPHIRAEIARLRGGADDITPVLSEIEMRTFLARLVRSTQRPAGEAADVGEDNKPGGASHDISVRDKLAAIKLARELAGPLEELDPVSDMDIVAKFHEIVSGAREQKLKAAPENPRKQNKP